MSDEELDFSEWELPEIDSGLHAACMKVVATIEKLQDDSSKLEEEHAKAHLTEAFKTLTTYPSLTQDGKDGAFKWDICIYAKGQSWSQGGENNVGTLHLADMFDDLVDTMGDSEDRTQYISALKTSIALLQSKLAEVEATCPHCIETDGKHNKWCEEKHDRG